MRLDTSLKRRNAIKNEVMSCTRQAIDKRLTHSQYLDRLTRYVYNHRYMVDDKTPQWVKTYIRGYIDSQFDHIWAFCTHWRVRYNGELVVGAASVPAGEWHNVQRGAQVWNGEPLAIWSDSADSL